MPVHALDHVNIRTRDIDGSSRFYADLLDLRPMQVPNLMSTDRALWLHDQAGRAIIHLRSYDCEPGPTGSIDHVALSCSGMRQMLATLREHGVAFQMQDVPSIGRTLVFVRDPNGVMLELNFAGD
jgi:catechol 2,3-dioxygenase-like lactoylglutathione lyase family enzyme